MPHESVRSLDASEITCLL